MESSDFVFYNNSWIKKENLISSEKITKTEALSLMKDQGLYVRNIYNWDVTDKPYFWYIIKDSFGGVEELPSKARNQVRKSLKTYEFKIVSFDTMMTDGYDLFNKSRERFGSNLRVTKDGWKVRLLRDENSEFWIGYDIESGKPASLAINTIFADYVDYSTMGISPDFPNNTYPMYGLIYEMNRYYLEEKKVPFVCDGARSITEHSNIQTVLVEKFKFRKAYCDLQIYYKHWLGITVRLLFPFRKFIRHNKVVAILRQEAWARGLEK